MYASQKGSEGGFEPERNKLGLMVRVPRVLKAKREMETRPVVGAFADSTTALEDAGGRGGGVGDDWVGIQVRRT